ncbi:hypothetical protein K1719_046926 [Acacia pycnantha]|nr:hypothetical protein K1719_046926 [Acacia pycnantha]
MTTIGEIITRFFILLFTMPFNFLKLSLSHIKWVLEFLVYHPFYSLHHHQPLQEFQILTQEEEPVEIWHPREGEEVDCAVCLNKIGEGDEEYLGSNNRVGNGRQVPVLFFKYSSFSDNSDERDNWWLR